MSLKALTWAFDQALKPDLKIVLLALADYADGDGVCWPGQKSIAAKAGMSERTVREKLLALEELGYIARRRRQNSDGYRSTDEYKLLPANPAGGPTGENAGPNRQTAAATEEPSEPSVPNKQRATRQVQMPTGLTWTNAHSVRALGRGVDVEVEFEKFKNHHLAKGSRFADWDRAFHSWLDRSRPEPGGGVARQRPGSPPRTPTDRMNAVLALTDPTEMGTS